jgi:hypothetical protein
MSDYTRTKQYSVTAYPVHANGASGLLKRCEPLLTPAQLKSRHLKGILELAKRFGITWTDEELKDQINVATNQAEVELGASVVAEQCRDKLPFDYNLYKAYIHLRSEQGPIMSIEDLSIVSSNGQGIFRIPPEWIETSNFHQRQINVIPLLAAYGVNSIEGAIGNAGIAFLTVLGDVNWVPAYWEILYTAGISKTAGEVPVIVNRLIGIMTTMELLSMIAAINVNTSVSLSQDGIGQSSSNPGPMVFQKRMEELTKEKDTVLRQLRRVFSSKIFLGVI